MSALCQLAGSALDASPSPKCPRYHRPKRRPVATPLAPLPHPPPCLRSCVAVLEPLTNITAVGVNCVPPALTADLLTVARTHSTKLLLAYPNSGEQWDSRAGQRKWVGTRTDHIPSLVVGWRDELGAAIIGGCCRVLPDEIAEIRAQLHSSSPPRADARALHS